MFFHCFPVFCAGSGAIYSFSLVSCLFLFFFFPHYLLPLAHSICLIVRCVFWTVRTLLCFSIPPCSGGTNEHLDPTYIETLCRNPKPTSQPANKKIHPILNGTTEMSQQGKVLATTMPNGQNSIPRIYMIIKRRMTSASCPLTSPYLCAVACTHMKTHESTHKASR